MTTRWDRRFIAMAEHVAGWSKDTSTQVGAVIVDPQHRVVSLGYNGLPRDVLDSEERQADRELKLSLTLHAENNAILFARASLVGCTIYTWPMPPCAHCASMIIQTGISKIVSYHPKNKTTHRWGHSIQLSREIYAEAGVEFIEVAD